VRLFPRRGDVRARDAKGAAPHGQWERATSVSPLSPFFFSSRDQKPRPPFFLATRREPPLFNPLFFLESRPKAPTSLFFSHTKGTSLFQPPPLPPSLPPSEKKIKNAEVDALSGRSRARAFLSRAFPRGRFRFERALHELDERLLHRVLDRVLAAAAGHRVLEDVLRRAAAPSAAWAALSISASARSSTTVFFLNYYFRATPL